MHGPVISLNISEMNTMMVELPIDEFMKSLLFYLCVLSRTSAKEISG